ncbi:PIR Superfamily Protein [Plasmodium ovale curtisi]|uniref:PIR Superfamily Protein n=1 Tax=Plasmodium ovale curtisi TaxID=864141 RepID=A0A1A8WFT7_PLAOA|nr:PIR Superfamily Protein [Plasmodium ovale curtisi]
MYLFGTNLDKLPTQRFYDILGRNVGLEYITLCESFVKKKVIENHLVSYCNILATNLQFIYEHQNELNFVEDPCTLFNYWIHDQIFEVYSIETDTIISNPIVRNFRNAWSEIKKSSHFIDKNTCNPEFYSIGTKLWKQWKSYTEYYVNYNELKNVKYHNTEECNIYKEYLNTNIKLYEMFNGFFSTNDTWKYPQCFVQDNKYKAEDLIYNLNCDKFSSTMKLSLESRQPSESRRLEIEPTKVASEEIETDNTSGLTIYKPELGTLKTVMLYIFPFIGSFLVFIFLYKFTPLESFICNSILNKNFTTSNINVKTVHKLLAHETELDDTNIVNRGRYIAYQAE